MRQPEQLRYKVLALPQIPHSRSVAAELGRIKGALTCTLTLNGSIGPEKSFSRESLIGLRDALNEVLEDWQRELMGETR